jgi:signal peptidase
VTAQRLFALGGRAVLAGLGVAVAVATAAVVALFLLPPVAGLDRYLIEGGSMEPTIPRGSMAYERRVPVSKLRIGDVITFVRPGATRPVTHRIIAIDRSGAGNPVLRTKGDANRDADLQPVRLNSTQQARVRFHVPFVGLPVMVLKDPERRRMLLIGAGALMVLFTLGSLWREGGEAVAAPGAGAGRTEA